MLIDYLNKTFKERCKRNPSYSLRAFARALDIDSSTLSSILRGKRPITLKTARKIIDGLGITDLNEAQTLLVETLTGTQVDEAVPYGELSMAAAEAIASWQHFAIVALLELKNFKGTEKNIAARLNLPETLVYESLLRLERLSLVNKQGREWNLTGNNMTTPAHIPSVALREGLRQHLEKAIDSLSHDSVDVRDISGITMGISKSKIPQAKKLIQDFRRRMAAFLETGNRDAVYRLNVQLFPLSQEKN